MTYAENAEQNTSLLSPPLDLPLISVIVVNYNGLRVIQRCLDSILRSGYPAFEIIAVDNASNDGSLQLICGRCKSDRRLRAVANPRNLGFGGGFNLAANDAKGKHLVFLNNDTEVEPDAFANLVAVLERDPSVGAAQSKLLMMTDRDRIDSAGDMIPTIGWPSSRGKYEIDHGQYDVQVEISSARGAAMIVRKAVFQEVGGFDPDYFMYYEDVDLSWRIRLRGYKIEFVPRSVVYHFGGEFSDSSLLVRVLRSFRSGRNYIFTLVKNFDLRNLFIYGSIHMAIHFMTAFSYIYQRRLPEALGLLLALPPSVTDFPNVWRKRLAVQRMRRVPDNQILGSGILRASITDYARTNITRRMLLRPAGGRQVTC